MGKGSIDDFPESPFDKRIPPFKSPRTKIPNFNNPKKDSNPFKLNTGNLNNVPEVTDTTPNSSVQHTPRYYQNPDKQNPYILINPENRPKTPRRILPENPKTNYPITHPRNKSNIKRRKTPHKSPKPLRYEHGESGNAKTQCCYHPQTYEKKYMEQYQLQDYKRKINQRGCAVIDSDAVNTVTIRDKKSVDIREK